MGRDWRSPGEAWVKTESLGWQRMKIIESQLHLACHQNQGAACSWPPRSQFGQHMEENCNKQADNDVDADHRHQRTSCETHRHGSEKDSSNDSQSSSTSSSPTGTPEKINARHIHPITISSPYGRYSASCCTHHNHDNSSRGACSPCKSPGSVESGNGGVDCRQHRHRNPCDLANSASAQVIPRSLSRETVNSSSNCCCAMSSNTQGLRQNNSVSDFRNTGGVLDQPADATYNTGDSIDNHRTSEISFEPQAGTSSQPQLVVLSQPPASVPVLMRNGVRIRVDGVSHGTDDQLFISSPTSDTMPSNKPTERLTVSPNSSRSTSPASVSPPTTPAPVSNQPQSEHESNQKPCKCCCCTSLPGAANSHHNLMMEIQPQQKTAPHCRISVRTREVAMHNTISEAFYRLDFYNAIHDIRRFNYICKLLHLLITQNLTSLSGCATRVLFTMLEQVAWEVSNNKQNVHVIRNLLDELKKTIQKYYCWGRPIGSSLLWQQHFETIERISQIVNGIELSPPKSDSHKVTFDKLPVEMVREILLRLNDYRDLVSSAQASPVMQTMIDGQYIWQKLCLYHFTEPQIKMALENGNNSIFVMKNSLRGVKYARTTSADGRSSYRNPVAHKQNSSKAATTRQQLEETSARRGSTAARRNSNGASSSSMPSSTSYVTNAVKIFDDKQRAMARPGTKRDSKTGGQPSTATKPLNPVTSSRRPNSSKESGGRRNSHSDTNSRGQSMNLDSSNFEIDWERVFHQLRKRFDLKEEYADCLLLCRHCRCLFWKSIGHPCIKSDDLRQGSSRQRSSPSDACPAATNGAGHNNGPSTSSGRNVGRDQSRQSQDKSARPSVASLSRTFDSGTRALAENNGVIAGQDENAQPSGQPPSTLSGAASNQQNPSADFRAPQAVGAAPGRPRQPLNNLNAQLREHNVNRQQRLQHQPTGRDNVPSSSAKREELVPKHVTITPQAFLKFFSL